MPEETTTPPAPAKVSFTVNDALTIANTIGALAVAIAPGQAALVALLTGASTLVRDTIIPAIKNAQGRDISIAEQAVLQAESAAERARVGAPPAVIN